jgi:hypothetical protein
MLNRIIKRIFFDGKKYQVTSNVFDYDLKCIKIWVGVV